MAPSASTSASKTPDPSARRHEAHGTHANQNHRPRYPFKPAVPSESSQVAQNLALNPHRPTLPPAHTPPRGFLLRGFSDACLRAAPRAVTGRHPKTLNDFRHSWDGSHFDPFTMLTGASVGKHI